MHRDLLKGILPAWHRVVECLAHRAAGGEWANTGWLSGAPGSCSFGAFLQGFTSLRGRGGALAKPSRRHSSEMRDWASRGTDKEQCCRTDGTHLGEAGPLPKGCHSFLNDVEMQVQG